MVGNTLLTDPGVLLPREDLDTSLDRFVEARGLITIIGERLAEPLDPEPGHLWKPRPGAADAALGNDRIPQSARLARFLTDRMASIDRDRETALNIRYINPMNPLGRGLFLKNAEGAQILWGEAPGEEDEGTLGAEEKWEKMVRWSHHGKNTHIPDHDYWEITRLGVIHKQSDPMEAGSPRVARPRRDPRAIPAKRPG